MKKVHQYKKVGRLQNNARYTIDYDENGKANVSWSYVKRSKRHFSFFFSLLIALLLVCVLILFGGRVYSHYHPGEILKNCSTDYLEYKNGSVINTNFTVVNYINVSCSTYLNHQVNYLMYYSPETFLTSDGFDTASPYENPIDMFKWAFLQTRAWLTVIALIVSFVLWIVLTELISKLLVPKGKKQTKIEQWMNEREAKMTGSKEKYRYVFRKCPENNIIEIPLFFNRFLKYKTSGEFSDYLKRIEVREHPFFEKVRRKKKNNWELQDQVFSCKFIFSQNPKKGQLTLKWK